MRKEESCAPPFKSHGPKTKETVKARSHQLNGGIYNHGLFIEIKKESVQIYCKTGPRKGKLVADPHIQAQAAILQQLNDLGYFARFGVGFDQCKCLLDWYMGKPEDPTLF